MTEWDNPFPSNDIVPNFDKIEVVDFPDTTIVDFPVEVAVKPVSPNTAIYAEMAKIEVEFNGVSNIPVNHRYYELRKRLK